MPDYFEDGYFAKKPAWHGMGNVSDKALPFLEAFAMSGVDWEVESRPVAVSHTTEDGRNIWKHDPNHKAIVRATDGRIYGVFSDSFQPIQNRTLGLIGNALAGEGCLYESILSLHNGARVVVLVQMPEDVYIAGERVKQFLMIANGHDGSLPLLVKPVDQRVVCANTFAMAMNERSATYRARHTANMTDAVAVEEARRFLQLQKGHRQAFVKSAEELLSQAFTLREYENLAGILIPKPQVTPAELADGNTTPSPRRVQNWEKQLEALTSEWWAEDLNDIRGTKWAALNAVVSYVDHGTFKGATRERRFLRAIDDTTGLKSQAYGLLK